MNTTMKTILIEDWYAPGFEVRINAAKNADFAHVWRDANRALFFRAAQPGLCRARIARRHQRMNGLTVLKHG